MPAHIHIIGAGSTTVYEYYKDSYHVIIGGKIFAEVGDEHQANWMAKRLNMARESKHHMAMNILTEQLGLSDTMAAAVLMDLHAEFAGHNITGVLDYGKPN